ncbi:MAG: hypothetical protein ABI151_12000 [Chitinophagaceae bacterium]
MKRVLLIHLFLFSSILLIAQGNYGDVFYPGYSKTIAPGKKFELNLEYVNVQGAMADVTALEVLKWTINGHEANSQNPSEGSLSVNLSLNKATYTAPAIATSRNPVANAVTVRAPGETKEAITLICNVTILDAQYRLTVTFEANGSEGLQYKYKGESYANLKMQADGSYMLAPADKTQNMDLNIAKAALTQCSTSISPKAYTIPFLFTIDKINPKNGSPVTATIAFNTVCPQNGKVEWIFKSNNKQIHYTADIDQGKIIYSPGTSQSFPAVAGQPFVMDGMAYLDVLQYLSPEQIMQNQSTNTGNAEEMIALTQRIKEPSHDPSYFQSSQGKADIQKMQAMQSQMGSQSQTKNLGESEMHQQANKGLSQNTKNEPRILPRMGRIRV